MTKKMLFVSFCLVVLGRTAIGQAADPQLLKTIVHMDSVLFDAFNSRNLPVLSSVFAKDLEFYHDKGGLTDYTTSMENFKKVFATTPDLRREIVPGTLKVYPVPGYGAIETGEHRFTHLENGKPLSAVFTFTQIWRFKDNEWKLTRVVSVGH